MKYIKSILILLNLIAIIFTACSKSNLPTESGTSAEEKLLKYKLTNDEVHDLFNSLSKAFAKTFKNKGHFSTYKNEIQYFKDKNIRLHINSLFDRNKELTEIVAQNMNVTKNELSSLLNALEMDVEIDVPVHYDKFNKNSEFLVAYFIGDDNDLNQDVVAYNKEGEKVILKLNKEPDVPTVSLHWSEGIYYDRRLGRSQEKKMKIEDNNIIRELIDPSKTIKLQKSFLPQFYYEEYIWWVFLYDDGDPWPWGDGEIEYFLMHGGYTIVEGATTGSHNCKRSLRLGTYGEDTYYYPICHIVDIPVSSNDYYYFYIVDDDYAKEVYRGAWDDIITNGFIRIEGDTEGTFTSGDARFNIQYNEIYY